MLNIKAMRKKIANLWRYSAVRAMLVSMEEWQHSHDMISDAGVKYLEQKPMYVTMDWNGHPITTNGDGYILPRKAEMILNGEYYPNRIVGEWPCDPKTGDKLPIVPHNS